MKLGPFRFSPPAWGILLFVFGAAVFSALGIWQIQRAQTKERLVAEQQAARAAGPRRVRPARVASADGTGVAGMRHGWRYIVAGRYDDAHQILLRDQMRGQTRGYRVWTPLVLANGSRVMVDRGWVAAADGATLPDPPAPAGRVRVQGYWRSFPQPAVTWGMQSGCDARGWPRALSYPDVAAVRCQYAAPVVDGLLLLNPEETGGFVREWDTDRVGLSPFGHYAYASQWFLMAVVAGVIFVAVNLRRY